MLGLPSQGHEFRGTGLYTCNHHIAQLDRLVEVCKGCKGIPSGRVLAAVKRVMTT